MAPGHANDRKNQQGTRLRPRGKDTVSIDAKTLVHTAFEMSDTRKENKYRSVLGCMNSGFELNSDLNESRKKILIVHRHFSSLSTSQIQRLNEVPVFGW